MAAKRIEAAITESLSGERPVKAILDAYNPTGSTTYVNFTTSKETRWQAMFTATRIGAKLHAAHPRKGGGNIARRFT